MRWNGVRRSALPLACLVSLSTACKSDDTASTDRNSGCRSCHGGTANAAPPRALDGAEAPSAASVGAHQAHLHGERLGGPVSCAECHVEPATADDAGHIDGDPPAEVTFGPLANASQTASTWDRATLTCANTYCHGTTLTGGSTTTPVWNRVDGSQSKCDACHGAPPPSPHPAATNCEHCHGPVAGPGITLAIPFRHADGTLDMTGDSGCSQCHGSSENAAPPRDASGNADPALLTVGAHQSHLAGGVGSRAVPCDACHLVPSGLDDAGHVDSGAPAELAFHGISTNDGAAPTWDRNAATCSDVYCHGSTLDARARTPIWNVVDGSQSTCGSCHGLPPPAPHPESEGCVPCHAPTAGPDLEIANRDTHVNGVVEVSGRGCEGCHGTPPTSANESYPGSGGAHVAHGSALGFACATCHGNNGSGPTHAEGGDVVQRANVDIVFDAAFAYPGGTTLRNAQSTTVYTASTMTCGVGCHNPVVGNPRETPNLENRIAWSAGAPGCTACHDQVATATPRNHDIASLGDAGCRECHDMARGHTTGTTMIRDPDPRDAFTPSATNWDGLCKTCHDGGAGTFFGGRTPRNVSAYWTTSGHGSDGIRCSACHAVHGSLNGPLFVDRRSASCMTSTCHPTLPAEFNQVPNGPVSHHRIEGGTGIQLACSSCHNPHLNSAHPNAAINPDNRWQVYVLLDAARTQRRSNGDYRGFCLACHDGAPPAGVSGAMNIAQALNGGAEPSMFRRGSASQHRGNHSSFNCMNCHGDHSSPGTRGINRGRLLLDYINVTQFSATTGYSGERSCGTSVPGGSNFNCH